MKSTTQKSTSWQKAHEWYHDKVGEEGHYYHQNVIMPQLIKKLGTPDKVIDFGCGQGILGRKVSSDTSYTGYDISPSFIKLAKSLDKSKKHTYFVQDITKPFKTDTDFSHAVILLAIQNIDSIDTFIKTAYQALKPGGKLLIVMNHPCFRIPRQSSWGIDEPKKLQYRRMDRYLSPLEIPIKTHPGKAESEIETISFHKPLSFYIKSLSEVGFLVDDMDEWISDKESEGAKAKMENRARLEFPLFLFIQARKPLI